MDRQQETIFPPIAKANMLFQISLSFPGVLVWSPQKHLLRHEF